MKKVFYLNLILFVFISLQLVAQNSPFKASVVPDYALGTAPPKITRTADGGFAIIASPSSSFDASVQKFSASGTLEWTKGVYFYPDYAQFSIISFADTSIMVGFSNGASFMYPLNNYYDIYHFDKNGNIIISRGSNFSVQQEDGENLGVINKDKTSDNYVVCDFFTGGVTAGQCCPPTYHVNFIRKFDSLGNPVYHIPINGLAISPLFFNIINIWEVTNGNTHDGYVARSNDGMIIRIGATGSVLWSKFVEFSIYGSTPSSFTQVGSDLYFVDISYTGLGTGAQVLLLKKLDALGNTVYVKQLFTSSIQLYPGVVSDIALYDNQNLILATSFKGRPLLHKIDLNGNLVQSKISNDSLVYSAYIDSVTKAAYFVSPQSSNYLLNTESYIERAYLDSSCALYDTLMTSTPLTFTESAFTLPILSPTTYTPPPYFNSTPTLPSLSFTVNNLCIYSSNCFVLPTSISTSSNLPICSGQSITLTQVGGSNAPGGDFKWYTGGCAGTLVGSGNSITVSPTTTTTYYVRSENLCGTSQCVSITVSVFSSSITALGPTGICPGDNVTLQAPFNNQYSYQWNFNGSPLSGATQDTYITSVVGNYACSITYSACGTLLSNTIAVTPINTPSSISAGGATSFCSTSSSVTLTANSGSGYTYQWTLNGNNISGATNISYSTNVSGSYRCNVTSLTCGTGTSNAITVDAQNMPTATLTANGGNALCSGEMRTLTCTNTGVTPIGAVQWKRNGNNYVYGGTSVNFSSTIGNLGAISCEVSNLCGTVQSNTITLALFPNPTSTISAQGPTTVCVGQTVTLTCNPYPNSNPTSYSWFRNGFTIPGATNQTYNATIPGYYGCQVTNCVTVENSSNQVQILNITTPPPATITAGGVTTFCNGGSVTLTANSGTGLTYQWQNNGVSIVGATNISYLANVAGNFSCLVSHACGSTVSNVITVILLPAPVATINPNTSVTICAGAVQTFTANTGVGLTYQWRRNNVNIANATNSSYTTSNTGNYSVAINDGGACTTVSTQVSLSNYPLPPSTNTASTPTTVCAGGGVVFNANSGAGLTYQWQKNSVNIAGATGISYTATTVGSYRVTVTNSNGCTKNSNAISAAFTGTSVTSGITVVGPATFCAGAGTYLKETTSIPGYNYQWQLNAVDIPGATLATYTPVVSGTYTVRVTAACGTALSLQQIITVNPAAIASISAAGSTSICSGSSVILNAQTGAGYSYQWQLNGSNIANETTSSYNASAAGNYTCVVTNTCGSSTSNSITVSVGTTPSASITAQGNTALCGGATVQLDANSGSGLSYQWQLNGSNINGATLISYVAAAAGNYTCAVTSSCGSATSNTITVTTGTVPAQPASIIGITQSCNPQNNVIFSIPPTPGATSYNWYSLNPAVTINPPNGGTTVSVNLGTTTSSTWSLRVEPINGCGTGPFRGTSVRRIVSGVTTVTGTNIICAATNGVAYSCNAVGGADSYLWIVPSGASIASGQGTNNIMVDFSNAFNGGSICVSSQLNCGYTAPAKCFSVAKNAATTPGNVSGNSSVCPGATGNFSIPALTGVTYNWTVPAGASITAGSGTNAITVQFPSAFSSGNVCVNVTNACGVVSVTKCRSVVAAAPSRPASVSGATSGVCNSLQAYTSAASTGATSYLWSVTGGTIQSGQGTQSVTVQWNNTGATGTLNVNGVNACGNGLVRSVAVNLKPASNGSITGNTTACANTSEVYNFTSLNGATNYLWAINTASGATVGAGQGTTAATINWLTNGGTVYCTPSNACGSSGTKTLAVSITCREAGEELVSDKNSLFNVAAIPNPFNNELNITSTVYGEGVVLKVSDMLGKTISQHLLQTASFKIQTPNLKNGIYFLEVTSGSQKKVIKVVKAE